MRRRGTAEVCQYRRQWVPIEAICAIGTRNSFSSRAIGEQGGEGSIHPAENVAYDYDGVPDMSPNRHQ